jgi:hypothetical protein
MACPNLEVLAVDVASRSTQFWKKSKIGDATLLAIAKNCPKFRCLCAAKCQITGAKHFNFAAKFINFISADRQRSASGD